MKEAEGPKVRRKLRQTLFYMVAVFDSEMVEGTSDLIYSGSVVQRGGNGLVMCLIKTKVITR